MQQHRYSGRAGRNLAAVGDANGVLVAWVERKSSEVGRINADIFAIADRTAPLTLGHLAKISPTRITQSSGSIAAIVLPSTQELFWATDRELLYALTSKL